MPAPLAFIPPTFFFFATLRVCISIYIFIYFKDLYIYLKDRATETEGMAHIQRESVSHLLIQYQNDRVGAGTGQSQEPQTLSRSPMWVAGAHAFPGALSESGIKNRMPEAPINLHI